MSILLTGRACMCYFFVGKCKVNQKGFWKMFRLSQQVTEPENKSKAAEGVGENAAAVQIASSSASHKACWSIIDRTLGGKCRFGGQGGRLFGGSTCLWGAMTRMRAANISQALCGADSSSRECGGGGSGDGRGNSGGANGVSPNSSLLNYEESGRRGCGLLCLPGELRSNKVIDLLFFFFYSPPSLAAFFLFDTRSQTTGQLSESLNCLAARSDTPPH